MPTPVLSRHFFSKNVRYIFFTKITLPFTGLSGQNSNGPSKIIGNNVYPVWVFDASPIVRRFDRSVRCHLHIFFLSFFIFEKSRSHFNRGINLFPKISTPDLSDFSPEKTPVLPNPQVAEPY